MDVIDSITRIFPQSIIISLNGLINNLINTANAAIFGIVDRIVVTIVGAPWYTSGVHMWKGAAEIFKEIETRINIRPTINNVGIWNCSDINIPIKHISADKWEKNEIKVIFSKSL